MVGCPVGAFAQPQTAPAEIKDETAYFGYIDILGFTKTVT